MRKLLVLSATAALFAALLVPVASAAPQSGTFTITLKKPVSSLTTKNALKFAVLDLLARAKDNTRVTGVRGGCEKDGARFADCDFDVQTKKLGGSRFYCVRGASVKLLKGGRKVQIGMGPEICRS